MKQISMAILGAGNIARQMAVAVNGLQDQVCAYAVASRSLEKAEAIWTRYMPDRQIVERLLTQGVIGEPISLEAEFSVPLSHKQRMYDPALAGGALLDLGMYCLTFTSMVTGPVNRGRLRGRRGVSRWTH